VSHSDPLTAVRVFECVIRAAGTIQTSRYPEPRNLPIGSSITDCPSYDEMLRHFKYQRSAFGARYVRQYSACDASGHTDSIVRAAYNAGIGVFALVRYICTSSANECSSVLRSGVVWLRRRRYIQDQACGVVEDDQRALPRCICSYASLKQNILQTNPLAPYVVRNFAVRFSCPERLSFDSHVP